MPEQRSSSARPEVKYKKDLLKRFGGDVQFDMTLFDFCERMQNDKALEDIYGNFCLNSLSALQRELLDLAFMEGDETSREFAESKVILRHYRLFSVGLNANHFDLVQTHLTDALRHSWVEDSVIKEAVQYFAALRPLFETGDEKEDEDDDEEYETVLNDESAEANKKLCEDKPRRRGVARSLSRELKKSVERTFSGEGLLAMVGRRRPEKRTKEAGC